MKLKLIATILSLAIVLAWIGLTFIISAAQGEAPQAYLPLVVRGVGLGVTPSPEPTTTATPTPTVTQTQTPPTDWLGILNNLRAGGGLPAVIDNTSWSSGCWYHARYMVKNNVIEHNEDPGNDWYTSEGQAAAQNGNLMVSSNAAASDESAIDLWMSGPFHGVGLLDPALLVSGFGSYREADGGWQMGACLDVIRGLGAIPPSVTFPVRWPEEGASLPYLSYSGTEYPDPLTSCSGYTAPSGPPIYLMIGSGNQTPAVTSHSFTQGGTTLEHCVFDETNYTHPDSSMQTLARSVLNSRDAIILMPRNPLAAGVSYTISITTNGQTYTWTVTTAPSSRRVICGDRCGDRFGLGQISSFDSILTGLPPQP